MINYYDVLGVDPQASPDVIKHVYRALAKAYHPDPSPENPAGVERFKLIGVAYETLMDPTRRREHDLALKKSSSTARGTSTRSSGPSQHERRRPDTGPESTRRPAGAQETAEQRRAREARQEKAARERRARQYSEQAERERVERERRERAEWERLAWEKAEKEQKRRAADMRECVFWREFTAWRKCVQETAGRAEREALGRVRAAWDQLSTSRQSRVAQEADRLISQEGGSTRKPKRSFSELLASERAKEIKGLHRRLTRQERRDWDLANRARKDMHDDESQREGATAATPSKTSSPLTCRRLGKAREQFEKGKYKAAIRTLWELDAVARQGDEEAARVIMELAGEIGTRVDGKLGEECAQLIERATKTLKPDPDSGDSHRMKAGRPRGPNIVMQVAGGVVFVVGIVLIIGNITGAFPTFPFAGFLVTAVGGFIVKTGSG